MVAVPNFLIIGAAKSGTTALYHYLKQHPQVFMCPVKEPKFFAHEGRMPRWSGPGDESYLTSTVTDLATYLALFHEARDEKALGEASTQYLYMERAPERIRHYLPRARLLAILRNPADVAFAVFLHKRRENLEPFSSFEQALAAEEERMRANWSPFWFYKQRGFYHDYLARYFGRFDARQIKVLLYDDFQREPLSVLRAIFSFLEVDEGFAPDMSYRPNLSGVPKSRALHKWLEKSDAGKYAPANSSIVEKTRWRVTRDLRRWNLSKPQLSSETRRLLMNDYREDVLRLQDLIGRDLSHWLDA